MSGLVWPTKRLVHLHSDGCLGWNMAMYIITMSVDECMVDTYFVYQRVFQREWSLVLLARVLEHIESY